MYNLIKYSNICLKISRSLWQYYSDQLFINNNGVIIDVPDDPDSDSFNPNKK